jgi:hypothetical protein
MMTIAAAIRVDAVTPSDAVTVRLNPVRRFGPLGHKTAVWAPLKAPSKGGLGPVRL